MKFVHPETKLGIANLFSQIVTMRWLLWVMLTVWLMGSIVFAGDISVVPLWDGETLDCRTNGDNFLANRYGGNPREGFRTSLDHTTTTVHSGRGGFKISASVPLNDFGFAGIALSGSFGTGLAYLDTRDISRFRQIRLWLRNETASPFSFVLEIKDYRESNIHRARRSFLIGSNTSWVELVAQLPADAAHGWTIDGTPDFTRTKLLTFVIETNQGSAVNGSIYLDDLTLVESGPALDPETASINDLLERLARRQFDGLWGTRDRTTGLLPLNSSYADVVALNVTAGLIKVLPTAVSRSWVSQSEADAYVSQVAVTLNMAIDKSKTNFNAGFLPPRYLDRVSLNANFKREESPIDGAFMLLALYQYKSLASTPVSVRNAVEALLNRFNFARFSSPQGWKRAFILDTPSQITDGTYDGYSGEIPTISLAAHLAVSNHVDIATHYHSGTNRVNAFLVDPAHAHLVHSSTEFRAPFLQWLFPLFVNVSGRERDSYPNPELARNPLKNAILYQQEVHAKLRSDDLSKDRRLFVQPDAGDDGTCLPSGLSYQQYSLYKEVEPPELFMPWSVGFSFLAEPSVAEAALRNALKHNLHGPLGLSDSARWFAGLPEPDSFPARQDFWNTALCEMAFLQYLHGGNEFLASLPQVRDALDKVFFARGDFNRDNKPDLLFNLNTRQTAIYYMDGPTLISEVRGPSLPADWSVVGVGDFNGDGKPDLLLFHASDLRTYVWYMNGPAYIGAAPGPTLPAGWSVAGVGDFNGDGKPDLLLFQASSLRTYAWYLNGPTYIGAAPGPTLPAGWLVAGVGDFNGDGKPDLTLFQASSLRTYFWYLNGPTYSGAAPGPTLPAGWSVAGVGDFNGDGKPDLTLFQASSLRTYFWYLNGPSYSGAAPGPTLPAGWSLVAP